MSVLAAGTGVFKPPDPDGFRRHVRDHKERRLVSKVMSEHEAIERFVQDGDYLSYDCNIWNRGPASLMRELIRQRKRDLWIAAKFTAHDATLLVAAGCVSRIDVGWMEVGRVIHEAMAEGRVQLFEWSNGALAYRQLAGALGVPFLPLRYLGGTDVFRTSGTKLIEDPYTGQAVCLVPALNPDVALIHVNQCDEFGNARIFGAGVAPVETAMASRKVVLSTEEIIPNEEIRRHPQQTRVPYYMVDAVVHAPFGGYPGSVPGLYRADVEHLMEFGAAQVQGKMAEYLDKWAFSVSSHEEMLEQRVGQEKMERLRAEETIREGYYE
ncbi:MAG: CoA-transferase [Chloroflexi bacterium RBG_16_68_14]|nr:MAG: CoA-transferase [Chloroflexi bacterium RBG_16_68_14]